MIFEGPEKKLEIVTSEPFPSLRTLGDDFWNAIVNRARAEVLSAVSSDACDAYLLSESSLFVCDRRMVMITCGRTTLIESALALVDRIPAEQIASLIYERKNENFPHMQHTTFAGDVERLRSKLPGTAVVFGDRGADHIDLYHLDRDFEPDAGDATLEVLMYDMAPRASRFFSKGGRVSDIREAIGFDEMLRDFVIDDHLFDPMGYSFNAVMGEYYTTLHVTPQKKGSYTSFESNHSLEGAELQQTITRLLDFFAPARVDVLLFQKRLGLGGLDDRFQVTARQSATLACGYAVEYAHIERETAQRRVSPK
jgi:S-adenosylmethionine decarboxylase